MPGTERQRAIAELIEDLERARREPSDERRARLQLDIAASRGRRAA